jgi:DNA-binding transcriptional MerR regulator
MSVTYKIGEAASLLHLKTYVLRFWETEFPQIAPLRTEKGQRLYTEEHLALLDRIRFLLHEHGLTIEGARKVLAEEAGRGVRYAPPSLPSAPGGMENASPAPAPGGTEDVSSALAPGGVENASSAPAPGGVENASPAPASRRETEKPEAGRNSGGVLRFPPLTLQSERKAEARSQIAPQPPVNTPPGAIPPIRTERNETAGQSNPALPPKAAAEKRLRPPQAAAELTPEEKILPLARNKAAVPVQLPREVEKAPVSRQERLSRQGILEELEAVAALLRSAPSGKKP